MLRMIPETHLSIQIPGHDAYDVPLGKAHVTVGREAGNDIVIRQPYLSAHHGALAWHEGAWRYTDAGSTNGTFVNGRRVAQATLAHNDVLHLGDARQEAVTLTLRVAPAAEAGGVMRIGTTALPGQPALHIGRDPASDIPLDGPTVSWHHARIERTPQGYSIRDLQSTNGTFVNGQALAAPRLLRKGDVIQIGPFKLIHEAGALEHYALAGGMRLDGLGLTREVGRGAARKTILRDVSLTVEAGEFVAIVGSSGAGKTTLMKALNGLVAPEGRVLVNGDDLYAHYDLYRALIGYVPQQNIVHPSLPVDRALRYAARLRLPPDTTPAEIEARIDAVLAQVDLTGQKRQVIRDLSGGERKRVSIAMELLAEPRLFFLDEPTSGLDPNLEKRMMHTLRHLADGGRTVVLITHATANLDQCDLVGFIAAGRLVYLGPPQEAPAFFGIEGEDYTAVYELLAPADEAVAEQLAQRWEQRFRRSAYYRRYILDRQRGLPEPPAPEAAARQRAPRVNPLRQFGILCQRYAELVARDPLLLTVLLAVMPIVGALLLLISKPNWLIGDARAVIDARVIDELANGAQIATYYIVGKAQFLLLMMAMAAILLGLFASAYEIVKERPIYQRERMVTVRLLPYLGSKTVVLTGFAMLQCLLLLGVLNLGLDLPTGGVLLPAPVELYVTLVLGAFSAIMLGLLISSLVPNNDPVVYLIMIILFFQFIFAGVFFDLPGSTRAMSRLTLSRWVMEGIGASSDLLALSADTTYGFQHPPFEHQVSTPADEGPLAGQTVTQTVEIAPEPFLVQAPQPFQIEYARTPAHIRQVWGRLWRCGLLFGLATMGALQAQELPWHRLRRRSPAPAQRGTVPSAFHLPLPTPRIGGKR